MPFLGLLERFDEQKQDIGRAVGHHKLIMLKPLPGKHFSDLACF
jgi:hypothetical protein